MALVATTLVAIPILGFPVPASRDRIWANVDDSTLPTSTRSATATDGLGAATQELSL